MTFDTELLSKDVNGYHVAVVYDDDSSSSSRDWCNLTTIIGWHRRMVIGDGPNIDTGRFDSWDDMLAWVIGEYSPVMIAPLFWYEHSGVTCSMGPPIDDLATDHADELAEFRSRCMDNAGWDSGVAGLVLVTPGAVSEVGTPPDLIEECARSEVETYAAWLRGEVYGYVVSKVTTCDDYGHEHSEVFDSCWGFVGEPNYALSEGIAVAESLPAEVAS